MAQLLKMLALFTPIYETIFCLVLESTMVHILNHINSVHTLQI
jgi:hypothetical protein